MYPIKKLSEVGKITTGFTPSKNNQEFWGGKTLFIKPPYLGTDRIITETEETLSDLGREKGKLVKKDSIMVCCIGSLGKIGIAGEDLCTNQQINSIYFNPELVDFKYGYYFCTTLEKIMKNLANKAIISIINKSTFSKIEIPLPPLSTQSAIVARLDSAFANIDHQITLIKNNIQEMEQVRKSVMESVFLQGAENERFKIDDFAFIKSGKRLPKGEKLLDEKTKYPYIRVTDFGDNGTIDLNNLKYISDRIYKNISNYIITSDDLYISIAGTIGKTGIIPEILNGANLTENAIRIVYKNKDKIDNKYIYYFTISENFKKQAGLATRAVAMPKLAISRLKEIKIFLPTLPRQHEIVTHLDSVFQKTGALREEYEAQIRDLESMKQSLLQDAFEGKLIKE